MAKKKQEFRSPDGALWTVASRVPGASNVMVVFESPDGRDRYAWHQHSGPEARDVTARLDGPAVVASLGEEELQKLFRRSMAVSTVVPAHNLSAGRGVTQ